MREIPTEKRRREVNGVDEFILYDREGTSSGAYMCFHLPMAVVVELKLRDFFDTCCLTLLGPCR